MANKYANLIGTNLIKDEYTKINTGFDGVDADMKAVESAIENHGLEADPHDQYALDTDLATLQTKVTSHEAEDVTQGETPHGIIYESGAWTPRFVLSGGTTGNNTYKNQIGWYVRRGNLVTLGFRISLSNKDAAMVGTIVDIGGLPFTASSLFTNGSYGGSLNSYSNLGLGGGELTLALTSINDIRLYLCQDGTNVGTVRAEDLSSTTNISGIIHYRV